MPTPTTVAPFELSLAPCPREPGRQRAYAAHLSRVPWHPLAFLVVLVLAAWLRLADLGVASLTHEEALRANIAYGGIDPLWGARRLPPLQWALGWAIQHGIGRTEWSLRGPYALAGIACVVLLYAFARRHLGPASALLTAAVAASHPVLITFSRKAKVFSLEALMTVALVWAGYAAYRRRSATALWAYAVVGVLGIGLTFTSSLLVAAWMPLLAYVVRRQMPPARRPAQTLLAVTLVLALAGVGWYLWLAGEANRDIVVNYQTVAFHAWPEAYTLGGLASWLFFKSYGLLRFVLGISDIWEPLKWGVGTAGLLAVAASLGVFWRRARLLCIYAALLGVEVVLAGALRLWPIGENQTVTFLVPLFVMAIGCGLQQFVTRMGCSAATAVMLVLCVLIPTVRAAKATLFPPPPEQHLRPVFAYLAAHLEPEDAVFIHYETRDAYGFYWRETGHPILFQPGDDRDNAETFASRFDAWMAEHPRVWFVFMLRRPTETGPWLEHVRHRYRIRDEYRVNDAAVYLIEG